MSDHNRTGKWYVEKKLCGFKIMVEWENRFGEKYYAKGTQEDIYVLTVGGK